jgi:outer membrane lipoprotein-sorting protein
MKTHPFCRSILAVALLVSPLPAANPPGNSTTQPSDSSDGLPRASLELLDHVQKQFRTIATMRGDFVQQKKIAVLNHTLTLEGKFAIQKPDRVMWLVNKPVKYAIRVEGEEVRQWDEDTNTVQVIHLNALGQMYDVYVMGNQPLSLRFAPKPGSMVLKLVRRIDVTFATDQLCISSMVIHESSGDNMTLHFSNIRPNQPIAAGIWEIPPK